MKRPSKNAPAPKLFAVIDLDERVVVARGLNKGQAEGYARGWKGLGHRSLIVPEVVDFWPAESLLETVPVGKAGAK